ncbi:ABC transporter transmembrane domain-containing protein [Ruegeria lacuscaerulensis]|uniref:ABC transporter transmembrane domain-containing protein n=1 Tax=Ruegeria lacuscaerulensis TaxID=55218 RepID=UPI00147A2065|nr:ABC transporter transmembrane domain-containing protein [Ruegeria lacuscaerulensis]
MGPSEFIGRKLTPRLGVPVWVASLSLNVLSLLMPISILLIFDRIIPFQSMETLHVLTGVLLFSAGFELVLRHCRSILLSTAAEDAARANYSLFMRQVLTANTLTFAKEPPSSYAERYAAIAQLRDHYAGQGQTLSIDLPFTLMFAILIGLIGGWLVLVPLGAFGIVLIFAAVMKRAQWNLFRQRKTLDTRRYAFLSELLSNMKTIKANRMEPQMSRRFEMLEDQTVDISGRMIRFAGFAQSFGTVFAQVSVAAMGLLGAYLAIRNQIGIAEMAACMLLNGRIVQPLTKLMAMWVQAENITVAWSRLKEMNELETHLVATSGDGKLSGVVTASDVSVRRLHGNGASFSTVSFTASADRGVLIEAEESWMVDALFDALTGQCDLDQGSILFDKVDAKKRVAFRGENALVALESEPVILSGTLLENLSAFGDHERIENAKTVAAALGLERRIFRLPLGYNTPMTIGSAFERDPVNRQLIALVRALALQPHILLMNEPTAVLDTAERQALADYLAKLEVRPTLIVASPDPRFKQFAPQVVRLNATKSRDMAAWVADTDLERLTSEAMQKGAA